MISQDEEPDFYQININQLHKECALQPRLYHKYSDLLVTARAVYEQAKSEKEFVAAELELAIRKDPQKFGLEKVTEKSVDKRVIISKRYQKANSVVLKARKEVNELEAIVTTIDHRKYALQDIVRLKLADYYADVKIPKGTDRSVVDSKLRNR